MKRFYLILCFLMSVMGSAWGQETVTETVDITPDNVTTNSNDHSYTAENLSVTLNAQIDQSKSDVDGNNPKNFKVNKDTGRHITVTPENGATITKVVLWGLDKQRPIKVTYNGSSTDYPAGTSTDDVVYETISGEGNNVTWTATFKEGYDSEIKFEYSGSNLHITKIVVTYTYTPITTYDKSFSVSDFNYTTGISRNELDRELGGFKFDFNHHNGTQFVKVNEAYRFFFRKGEAGTLTISPDDNNSDAKITQVVLHAERASDLSTLDGFSVTDAEGNSLNYEKDETAGTITISCDDKTSAVNITTDDFSCAESKGNLYINSIDVTTDREVTFEKITPSLTFENEEKSVVKGTATVANALSTTPSNFAVTYNNTEDPNSIVSEIADNGTVTLNTGVTGTATITASFDGNKYYESASKSYTITVTSGYPSTFAVADLNYLKGENGVTANQNGLDRTIGGFTLTFTGGNAIKYNGDNNFFFRSGEEYNGTLTITPTDSENKITKVVINTLTDITGVTGFSATADGDNVEANPYGKALTVIPTSEAGNVVINTDALSTDVKIASIYIETTKQITDAMVTPELTFANQTVDVLVGGTVSNALTTSPKNFIGVTYSSSNTDVATVDESTGAVTINAAGSTTITATFAGTTFFNEASAAYTLNVSNPNEVTLYIADFNYNEGTSVRNGLNRENVRGYNVTFNGDASSPKFNGVASGLTLSGENATMTIAPTLEGNEIISVKFTKATSGSLSEEGISTDVVGTWTANGDELTFTPTAYAESITFTGNGNAFAISAMTISSTQAPFEGDYSKPTPELSFAQSSITVYTNHTESITNTITTTPSNFRVLYKFEEDYSGLVIDEKTGAVTLNGATAGTYTVQASFNGKRQGDNSTTNELYNASGTNVAQYQIIVKQAQTYEAGTWNFTSWTENDLVELNKEDGNWNNDNDNRYVSVEAFSTDNSAGILSNIHSGLTLTAPAGKVSVYYSDAEEADGSLRLHDHSAVINLPALTVGRTIIVTTKTTSSGNARGIVFTGDNADKVVLMEGSATSTEKNTVVYYVTENISGVSLTSSHNGLYIYSIVLGSASLYWMNGDEIINSIDVIESNYSTALNNVQSSITDGVTYSSDNEAVTVDDNGNITINTFTAGTSANIIATAGSESVVLKVNMKLEASISYEQTTAEGTVGLSFVEPVLTKNPAALNVVKWKSSDPEVATVVESTGEVTLVSAGTTTITAYIEANNYYAYHEASYTLTVNEKPEVQEPWTLSLVEAGDASVATGSTGHKLTMNADGTIQAGQVTDAIPGLTLSFGKTGGQDWTVGTPESGYTSAIVAQGGQAIVDKETNYPTGGTYLGLEPTVNGVLSLDASYFGLQSVVLVDKSTQTVVASYRHSDSQTNDCSDKEFSVPLQADHTYYLYNAGNGKSDEEYLNYALQIRAITFTPVFLDRIGHVIVKNSEYNITGAQLADDIHDYPTFSNVHAEEGGSVHYHSYQEDGVTENTVIYLNEDGQLVIDGEGTAILEAHVSHTDANGDECHSIAKCTVTYTKTALKFATTSYTNVDVNQLDAFTEPKLNYIPESGVTYTISGDGAEIDENGNITALKEGTTFTVTATIEDNLYYTSSASYTITTVAGTVPLTLTREITLTVGTRGYDLLTEGIIKVNFTDDELKRLSSDSEYPDGKIENLNLYSDIDTKNLRNKFYWNKIADAANRSKYGSTDPSIAFVNAQYRVDAKAPGTVTLRMRTNKMYLWDEEKTKVSTNYVETYFEIKVNVVPADITDTYLSDATYRTWNFHNGFDAEELSSYDNDYAALGNSTEEAENFITHIPSGHDFWIYDSENNTLKSNTLMPVEDNKIDRNTAAFIANEPMNNLSLTSTATNCFASTSGEIDVYRASKPTSTYDYESTDSLDDKNVLTFFTFRSAGNNWAGDNNLNTVSDITFNAQANMCGITGVDKDEHVTPYRSIQLSGKAAFIRVNDIQSGMWMSVIADNNSKKNIGFVQLASDDAESQAMGESFYKDYSDTKDTDLENTKYPYNRVTNVFPYMESNGKTVAIEQEGAARITNIIVGYPAGMGTMNTGGGEKSPSVNGIQRTYGYATFVSPYNIDLTGQTALKAYICDYYGTENNLVHMVQIKHIPANTPVMLKGYARDMYVLYISEGNKDVDHGISEEVFAKNRLVGALEDGMMVQPTEEGLTPDGGVTTWHNLGLTQNKFLTFTVASPIAKGRAYLRITQEEYEDLYVAHVSATAASTSAKIVFEDSDFDYSADEKPTGIEEVETNKSSMGNGYYYNLNGVRINGKPTQKGIYILNGKKIVVR